MSQSNNINWKSLILDGAWLDRLDRLTIKRFGAGGLAEEASAYVIEKLSADDWHVFLSFKGQSKPETYIHTLANNFIEEFSRKRFGRPRPPEWLKRQGDLWVKVWKMVCLERRLPQTVIDLMCAGDLREPLTVQKVIQAIKARLPWCGDSNREIAAHTFSDEDSEQTVEDQIVEFNTPETSIETSHLRDVMHMLGNLLSNNPNPASSENAAHRADSSIKDANIHSSLQLSHVLTLSDQEWVILRMVYQDGMKLNAVASFLGLKAHEPGRIMKTTLQRIATALETLGVSVDDFRERLLP